MLHWIVLMILSLNVPAMAGSAEPLGIGRSMKELTAMQATEHFEIHYRPGSRAGAAVDRTAYLAEKEYARIVSTLKIAGRVDESVPFHLFLYDDTTEMTSITEVEGTGGFSAGRESHIPYDNDQTRVHEMVHIVVAAMESTGDEERNMFFVEGLANAVLRFVHGVPVHAVAAHERRRGSLPPLATLTGAVDYYAYLRANPGFNGYDVGGSFMLYLLERFAPKRVMDYYHGKPAVKTLKKSLKKIEKDWHAFLDAYVLRPEVEILLKKRRGDEAEFTHLLSVEERLPADLLGSEEEWESVFDGLAAYDDTGTWELAEDSALGENLDGAKWSICENPAMKHASCAIRATIEVLGGCWGVQLRIGDQVQAMVLGQGVFIYHREEAGVAFSGDHTLQPGHKIDLILLVQSGKAQVWIDGDRVLEADTPNEARAVGIGIVGGKARFTGCRVKPLDR